MATILALLARAPNKKIAPNMRAILIFITIA
jgi:hypothetical protein